ncbi:MAG: tetratricopeptide repeat protein [Syntrophaceae bacterium]|nr:tetratricopeptide repeat protein [Syntrophaceae bacterium]
MKPIFTRITLISFLFVLFISISAFTETKKDNEPDSIVSYTKAIKKNRQDAEAYLGRGIAYGNLGKYKKAIADFNKAIKLSQKDANVYYNRGIAYLKIGNHKKAKKDFNKAIELNPRYAKACTDHGFARDKSAYPHNDWMLTGYGAMLTPDSLGDTLTFRAKYEDSYIVVWAVSKRLYSFKKIPADFEMEGQVGKHFGDQKHVEFNVVPVVLRWNLFPWDAYVDTSFATGVGISYALETPKVEAIGVDHTPRLLGYLMFEFAFALPNVPRWSFVTRVHHRSGANGIFDGRLDASNAIGFGIKYIF